MYLVSLIIMQGGTVVRDLRFKPGLNLILDKPTDQSIHSGNNVGKTTVLRLVDFCLGSEGDDIWQDPEFKNNINQDVYDYLHGIEPVSITLIVKRTGGGTYRLTRLFQSKHRTEPLFLIEDTVSRNITEYRSAVRKLLFSSDGGKPSLRQLVPKFIRSSQSLMSKTLKFLGDFGSEVDYEALHLFLFGFLEVDVLELRPHLTRTKKKLARDLEALSRWRKQGEIEQLLIHLRREIEAISLSGELRGEVPEIASHANEVTAIRAKAANVAGMLGRLESEIAAIQMTIGELESEYSDIDRYAIEAIYREANRYIPELHHDWNDLKDFVQNLRGRKQRFLQNQITILQAKADIVKRELETLQERESSEINTLFESRAFNHALEMRADLQEKLKRLGSLEQDLQDMRDLKAKIVETEAQLKTTKDQIEEGKALLHDRVGIFNKYFSGLSKALYGEEYLLHFDETDKGSLSFQLTSVGSNVGAGKKVSQTAAFDLAYIKFLEESGIPFPRFVCHDGVESIHGNQLAALLTTGNQVDGQLIIATLRDKLPVMPKGFVKENTILELSQDDRLFRI